MEEYGDFDDYVFKTTEPGILLIIFTALVCFASFAIIPSIVVIDNKIKRRYENKKEEAIEMHENKRKEGNLEDGVYYDHNDDNKSVVSSAVSIAISTTSSFLTDVDISRKKTRRPKGPMQRKIRKAFATAKSENSSIGGLSSDGFSITSKKEKANNQNKSNLIDDDLLLKNPEVADDSVIDISPDDAIDSANLEDVEALDFCCGPNTLCHPHSITRAYDGLVNLSRFDPEMKRIIRLAIPYTLQEAFEEVVELVYAIILGRLLGTDSLTVYVLVETFIGTTGEFVGGVISSTMTVLPHAIGSGNNYLAGQYLQISMVLYTIFMIPSIVFWYSATDKLMIWLGFSPEIAQYAQQYANVAIWVDLIEGWNECFMALLEVTDHENFSCFLEFVSGSLFLALTFIMVFFSEDTSVVHLAWLNIAFSIAYLMFVIAYAVFYKPWFKSYSDGMFRNFAMKVRKKINEQIPYGINPKLTLAYIRML